MYFFYLMDRFPIRDGNRQAHNYSAASRTIVQGAILDRGFLPDGPLQTPYICVLTGHRPLLEIGLFAGSTYKERKMQKWIAARLRAARAARMACAAQLAQRQDTHTVRRTSFLDLWLPPFSLETLRSKKVCVRYSGPHTNIKSKRGPN